MRKALGLILAIGGAGYLLLHKQIAAALEPDAQPAPGAAAADTSAAGTPIVPPPVATDAAGTRARLLAAAQREGTYTRNGGRLTAYQWGYFYSQPDVRGVPPPAPEDLGISDAAMLLSLDEYWAAATSHGMAGVRPRRRPPSIAAAWGA